MRSDNSPKHSERTLYLRKLHESMELMIFCIARIKMPFTLNSLNLINEVKPK